MPSPSGCAPRIATSGVAGPVIEYTNDGSSPLTENTQISTIAVPEAGRVSAIVPAPRVHVLLATEKSPIAATVNATFGCGASDPNVDASKTEISFPCAAGLPGVSAIMSGVVVSCATVKLAMLETVESGLLICTFTVPTEARSAAERVVVQSPRVSHEVRRAVPATIITDPGPGALGTKFPPCTRSVKPPAAPAKILAGSSRVMIDVVAMVTLDAPVREVSSELVATMLTALGDGVETGAVNIPAGEIVPHTEPAPAQPAPVTFQVTL